jgi:hypothetical protein
MDCIGDSQKSNQTTVFFINLQVQKRNNGMISFTRERQTNTGRTQMVSTMRTIQAHVFAAFIIALTCTVSIFRDILWIPGENSHGIRDLKYVDDHLRQQEQLGMSTLHHMFDQQLDKKYTTTHQKIRGSFSLLLNEENGADGDNAIQHKGILRVTTDKLGKWPRLRHQRQNETFKVGGEPARVEGVIYAKYVDDKRVIVTVNHTILPSFSSSPRANNSVDRLCRLLRDMTIRSNLDEIPETGIPPIVLKIVDDCSSINEEDGQGSLILSIYGVRLATAMSKVDLQFECVNETPHTKINGGVASNNLFLQDKSRKLRWVLPWFINHQSAAGVNVKWPYCGSEPKEVEVCGKNAKDDIPIERMTRQIRDDVRKMAVQLVGSHPDSGRTHPLIPQDSDPWIPDVFIDDVIIHFPCYEDANGQNGPRPVHLKRAGVVHFSEYATQLSPDVKSIGIVTEATKAENSDWCYRASTLLVQYLESYLSKYHDTNSVPTISLYDSDILPLQYARMVMAKQTFSSFSLFGMIPVIGTYGSGHYFHSPDHNAMGDKIIQKASSCAGVQNNIHMWNASKTLSADTIAGMKWDDLSRWLVS